MVKQEGRLVWKPASLTHEVFLFLQSLGLLVVLSSPHRENQNQACPAEGLETLPSSLPLPPGLAMIRAQVTPCDCSRKPSIAKGHCVGCPQSVLLGTLDVHTTSPAPCALPLPLSDFNTLAVVGQGGLIKGGQDLDNWLRGLESVTEPAPWCGL